MENVHTYINIPSVLCKSNETDWREGVEEEEIVY